MKKLPIILIINILFISHFAFSQGFLKADGPQIVNANGEKIILRGMGLGGWMLQEGYMLRVQGIPQQQNVIRAKITELIGKEKTEEFYDAWISNHTRKIDIDSMAAWGFNSIRLAMHYNLYTLSVEQEPIPGKDTWLEKGFALTDSLLKWCANNKMYLILDLHGAPGGQGNDLNIADRDPSQPSLWQNEANEKKMIALWRKLAERYANHPWIGAYDIINEPNWGFEKADDKNGCGEPSNIPLKKLMVAITNTIREVDKNHIIIIEGNCWGNNYSGVFPPWDHNTVISFHKYWNYNDQASIQKFIDIRKQYGTPVWLGESGENSNLWFRDAIHLMEKNEIGWAWWPLKKLGFNNPLEVRTPPGYQKILNYWNNKGEKPTADEAYQGLMELATNLKLENCIYHKDVIDAMFRQTRTTETIPFKKYLVKSGSSVLAVDYDMGRNGFAYFDKDTANYWVANGKHSSGNQGRIYRNDGVDISKKDDQLYVDHFETGEWLQYTLESAENKTFHVSLVLSNKIDGEIALEGVDKSVVKTPANDQWHTVEIGDVLFHKGKNTLRIKVPAGEFDFQSIHFK